MKTMKFSIIVPALNEEKYIGVLLGSLVQQKYLDFEVIVIDGKSEDKTVEEVQKYFPFLELRIIASDVRNVSYQRNLGAKNAHSDHLIFFDADVKPEPDFLERLAKRLNKKHVDALTSWNKPMSKKLIDKVMYGAYNVLFLEGLKKFSPSAMGTFIYVRKEVFEKMNGFDMKICLAEDFDLVKRIHQAGYVFDVVRKPAIPFSVRRLNEEGRANFVKKQIKAGIYITTRGPITDAKAFSIKWGSHV